MGWESEFFFMEPKNELHKHTNTHSSKETGFTLERKKVQSSQHSPGEGVKSLKRQILQQFIYLLVLICTFLIGSDF